MRKYLKFILLFLFAVFIFWFFGRSLDWEEVSRSLRHANAAYLILATLIICFGYLLRAFRWRALLAPITETSLRELFATTTVGYTAVFLVGRAGEIVRPMWLPMRDRRVRPSAALVTLGFERICDLAAIVCFFAVNLLWFDPPQERAAEFAYVKLAGVLMLVGVVFGILALYVYQKYSRPIIKRFEKAIDKRFVPRRLRRIFLSILRQLAVSLEVLRDWREVVVIVLWTLALWFAIAVPTWLVILAFGLPLGFSDSLFVMGWAAVGSVVPTPGGAAGAFHAATAGGLIFLGVDLEQATAVSFAMHLVYFAPAIFFGFYYFLRGDISLSGFRDLLSGEHAVEEVEHETESRVSSPKSQVGFQSST